MQGSCRRWRADSRRFAPDRTIYVAHPPKSTLDDVVHTALQAEALAFKACPHIVARLWSAKTRLSAGSYEGVFMMQPAKDRIGTDGIRFFAAIARMGTWVDAGADRGMGDAGS